MEIRQLKYFISAAEQLNLTRAAKECYIAQSAMTVQIASLEREMGVKLFERHSRGLILTDAGQALLKRAREIVALADQAQEEMSALHGEFYSTLRVGHYGGMFQWDLIHLLRRFRAENPRVKVIPCQCSCAKLIDGILERELDFALMPFTEHFYLHKNWLDWKVLEDGSFCLAVAEDHPLAGRTTVTNEEVEGICRAWLTWDMPEEQVFGKRREIDQSRQIGEMQDFASIQILVASGYCAGAWPARWCAPEYYPGLRFVPIEDYPEKVRPALVWPKGPMDEEHRQFAQQVYRQFSTSG